LCNIDPQCKDSKKKTRRVATLVIRESVLEQCSKKGDEWGLDVHSRLMTCNDLVAEEAVYHIFCHVNFFRVKKFESSCRPKDYMKAETFENLCQ